MTKKRGIEFLKVDGTWLKKAVRRSQKLIRKEVKKACRKVMKGRDEMDEKTLRDKVMAAMVTEMDTGTAITREELRRMVDEVIKVVREHSLAELGKE